LEIKSLLSPPFERHRVTELILTKFNLANSGNDGVTNLTMNITMSAPAWLWTIQPMAGVDFWKALRGTDLWKDFLSFWLNSTITFHFVSDSMWPLSLLN
jgi:hypothetical protein